MFLLHVQHGADANGSALEVYPLGVAAIEGNNKVIQLLVDHQADPNVPTYVSGFLFILCLHLLNKLLHFFRL